MFGFVLVKKEELERLRELERVTGRLSEAHRWLSEFDDFLKPMWDYIFNKTETITLENGKRWETYSNADINRQRESMRGKLARIRYGNDH